MPARRLVQKPKPIAKFSIVGRYVADTGRHFVQHVAILRDDAALHYACPGVHVLHMGPPIVAGPASAAVAKPEQITCQPHLAGGVVLDADDIEGMNTWLTEVDKEKRPSILDQYVVQPAMRWASAENGTRLYRQFSCVGFVLACYRSIGVDLIDDSDPLRQAEVDLETVASAYGNNVRHD